MFNLKLVCSLINTPDVFIVYLVNWFLFEILALGLHPDVGFSFNLTYILLYLYLQTRLNRLFLHIQSEPI